MVLFLLFLCVLCILPVCSIFEGNCLRKDPPPGVLVVSPGSSLVLTCGGDVKVNGTTVILTGSGNNEKKGPTPISRTTGGSDWEDEEEKDDGEDVEGKGGSRVTRGVILRHQWKRSKLPGQKEDGNCGEATVISQEEVLSLDNVATTDAGKYTCHRRGEEKFAVKVIVADPPETPSLSCYKKSPRSQIRCEWRPQKLVTKHPNCHLVLKKNKAVKRIPCSYSSQQPLCWCTLEYNEDDQRVPHEAFLCVTSILGNATSQPTFFKPLDIVKPDPPSGISVHEVEGQESEIKVTWNFPPSWKQPDNYYILLYEIRYRPSTSTYAQANEIRERHSYTITDALPCEKYLIQLRAKEEYDGHWSEWSLPVYATSWKDTCNLTTPLDYLITSEGWGSGSTEGPPAGPENVTDDPSKMPQYVFWISGLFAFFSTILAIYFFRHKDSSLSKFHKRLAITWCRDLSLPSPPHPEAPKGETLVTFVPQLYEDCPSSDMQEEEENEEEQSVMGGVETMNFNNTSYFFL